MTSSRFVLWLGFRAGVPSWKISEALLASTVGLVSVSLRSV